jgi:hypothetical protein
VNPEIHDLSNKGQLSKSFLNSLNFWSSFERKSTHLRVTFVQNVNKQLKVDPPYCVHILRDFARRFSRASPSPPPPST